MRITLLETTETAVGFHVRFSTEFGSGAGLWRGGTPAVGSSYDVEIEVPRALQWGTELELAGEQTPVFFSGQDTTHLCGQLESVSDDGVIALRLGPSVIVIETRGPPAPVGSWISVTVEAVELYDANT